MWSVNLQNNLSVTCDFRILCAILCDCDWNIWKVWFVTRPHPPPPPSYTRLIPKIKGIRNLQSEAGSSLNLLTGWHVSLSLLKSSEHTLYLEIHKNSEEFCSFTDHIYGCAIKIPHPTCAIDYEPLWCCW